MHQTDTVWGERSQKGSVLQWYLCPVIVREYCNAGNVPFFQVLGNTQVLLVSTCQAASSQRCMHFPSRTLPLYTAPHSRSFFRARRFAGRLQTSEQSLEAWGQAASGCPPPCLLRSHAYGSPHPARGDRRPLRRAC